MPTEQLVPVDDLPEQEVPEDDLPGGAPKKPGGVKRFLGEAGSAIGGFATGTAQLAQKVASGDWAGASRDLIQPNLDALNRAGESFGERDYLSAARHGIAGAIPMIGPMAERAGDKAQEGDYAGAAGSVAGNAALLALPKAVNVAKKAVPKAVAAAGRGMESRAVKMQTRALDPTVKQITKGKAEAAARTTLEQGIRVGKGPKGIDKLNANLQSAGERIGALEEQAGPKKVVGLENFSKAIEEVKQPYMKTGDRVAGRRLERVRSGVEDAAGGYGGKLSISDAQATKRALQETVDYNAPKASTEAQRVGASALRKDIANIFPELGEANTAYHDLKNVQPFIEKSLATEFKKQGVQGWGKLHTTLKMGGVAGGFAAGGPVGGAAATAAVLALEVLKKPAVRSQIALSLYKNAKRAGKLSSELTAMADMKATVGERIQALQEAVESGDISVGLSIRHLKTGENIPRTKVEMHKRGASILRRLPPELRTVENFNTAMKLEVGDRALEITDAKGTKLSSPEAMFAGAKAQLAAHERLAGKGGIASPSDVSGSIDRGSGGRSRWFKRGMKQLQAEIGKKNLEQLIVIESIYSPDQGVHASMQQSVRAAQAMNTGKTVMPDGQKLAADGLPSGRYPNNNRQQLAKMEPSGPKVEDYDQAKQVGAGLKPESAKSGLGTVDKISTTGFGFPGNKANSTREFQRGEWYGEAKRRGSQDINSIQASYWEGEQHKKAKGGKNVAWAEKIREEIEAAGGPDAVFGAEAMDAHRNSADGRRASSRPAAVEAESFDFGRNVGEGVEYVNQKAGARAASSMESENGFTLTREGLPPRDGYSFSPYKQHEKTFDRALSSGDIIRYAKANEGLLSQPGHNLGGWKSDKRRVLDVAVHERDFDTAMKKAQEANQEAIWDHKNGVEIPVPKRNPVSDLGGEASGNTTTIIRLKDGRIIESEPHPTSTTRNLPTHLSLLEKHGLSPEDVAETGWRINGELDFGGGGSIGKGGFTLGEYDAAKAKQ